MSYCLNFTSLSYNSVIEHILYYIIYCAVVYTLLLQCIICRTDNGRGEGFNDFPCRNKFAIYLYTQGKLETRGSADAFSPLSGAHAKWSFNVVVRFVPFCLQLFLLYICVHEVTVLPVLSALLLLCDSHNVDRAPLPHVDRTLRTSLNFCFFGEIFIFFFGKRFVNIFIWPR